MQMLFRFTLLSALILPAVACKGPTGLKADTKLNELSEDEKDAACDQIETYTKKKIDEEDATRAACVVFASLLSANESDCDAAVESCIAEAMPSSEESSCILDGDVVCTATAEELDACLDEQIDTALEFIDAATCKALFADNAELPSEEVGPQCSALSQKCPGLFSSGSEE